MKTIDNYGREILTEAIPSGGMRYFAADGTISLGLDPADDIEALRQFNAFSPLGEVVPETSTDSVSDGSQ